MKSNKALLLVIIVAVISMNVYSYYEAKSIPLVEVKHQEKMADIQYKKEKLNVKEKEKKAKLDSKKNEAEAAYKRQRSLLDIKKSQENEELARYKNTMRDMQFY